MSVKFIISEGNFELEQARRPNPLRVKEKR
jgi:hypothetical protein